MRKKRTIKIPIAVLVVGIMGYFATGVLADYFGAINRTYTYRTITNDPDGGERVQYDFQWDTAGPTDTLPSPTTYIDEDVPQDATRAFTSAGSYQTITVARDDGSLESGDSNIVTATIALPSTPGSAKFCQVQTYNNPNSACVATQAAGANTGDYTLVWDISDPWLQTLISQYILRRTCTGPCAGGSPVTVNVGAGHGSTTYGQGTVSGEDSVNESSLDTGCYEYLLQAEDNVSQSNFSAISANPVSVIVDGLAPGAPAAPDVPSALNGFTADTSPTWQFIGIADNGNDSCWDTGVDYYNFQILQENPANPGFANATLYQGPIQVDQLEDSDTITQRIAAGSDDGEEDSGTAISLTDAVLDLVNDGGSGNQTVAVRFPNVSIPVTAVITNAYIEFSVAQTDSGVTNLTIAGEDVDTSAALSTTAGDLSVRTTTNARATWSNVPAWNTVNAVHQSPDLTAIVQEIVNRPGWTTGNAMTFLITGSGQRRAHAYEGDAGRAPNLVIQYDVNTVAGAHTFTQQVSPEGTYYAQVQAVDLAGNVGPWSTEGTVTITIAASPTADWNYCSPAADTIQFADLSTGAPGETINFWDWDFGDGNTCTGVGCQNPLHNYVPDTIPPPDPTCVPGTSSFNGSVDVTCTDAEPGVIIRYTTDGTDPDVTDTVYTSPLNFTANTTLRVRAWDASTNASGVNEYVYTLNAGPTAVDDGGTGNIDTSIIVSVLANDSDPDGLDNSSVTIVSAPSDGTITNINTVTGAVTYTPDTGYTGADAFTYTVDDALGATSNVATVNITVTALPKIAFRNKSEAQANGTDTLSPSKPSGVVEGDLLLATLVNDNGGTSFTLPSGWTEIEYQTGSMTSGMYYKVAGASEPSSYTFTAADSDDFMIQVAAFYSPWGVNTNGWTLEDSSENPVTASSITSNSITATDDNVFYLGITNDDNENFVTSPSGMTILYENQAGSVALGTYYEFVDAGSHSGTLVWDASDQTYAAAVAFSWTEPVDNPPVANNDTANVIVDTPTPIDILANDTDEGSIDATSVVIVSDVANGGTAVNPTTGVVTYTPNTSYSGPDSFTYTVQDNTGNTSNIATVSITVAAAPADWWDTDWKRRRVITFDNASQSENLDNFPILATLNEGSLNNINYTQTQDSGQDIRFVDDDTANCDAGNIDGSYCVLDHEIETWDESGDSLVWVKVPRVDGSSSTDRIWVYYGNTGASDGQDAANVWSNGYVGVWHLSEEQSGTGNTDLYQDSTSNALHADDYNSATGQSGQIGNGQEFDSSDYADVPDSTGSPLDITGDITIESWIYPTTVNNFARFLAKQHTSDTQPFDMYGLLFDNSQSIRFGIGVGGSMQRLDSGSTIQTNQWTHVVGTRSGANMNIYLNGSSDSTKTDADSGSMQTNNNPLRFGRNINRSGSTDQQFIGQMDELRLANVERSADWIAAQFETMDGTFQSYSSEEVIAHAERATRIAGAKKEGNISAYFQEFFSWLKQKISLLFGNKGYAQVAWWDTDWQYRRELTLNNSTGSTLANVPVLIQLTNTRTDSYADIGDGSDMRFTDSGGTELAFEQEVWKNLSNESYIWVNVPSLPPGDTDIYMYYNYTGGSIPAPPATTATWDSNFQMVLHLHDDFQDSTIRNNDATNNSTGDTAGQIGDGQSFNGSSQWIEVTDSADFDPDAGITMEAWVYNTDSGGEWRGVYTKGRDGASSSYWTGLWRTSANPGVWRLNGGANRYDESSAAPTNAWTYMTGTVTQGGAITLYQNGGLLGSNTAISGEPTNGTENIAIGRALGVSEYFQGNMDEVRWSNTVRSPDWITVQYASMSDALVTSWGTEETNSNLPTAPSGLGFASITQTAMTLNWTDEATNEDGYRVYMSTNPAYVPTPGDERALLGADIETYDSTTHGNLSCGTMYYWWVEAYNTDGRASISGGQATAGCPAGGSYDVTMTVQDTGGGTGTRGPITIDLASAPSCRFNLLSVAATTCTSIEVVEWSHAEGANQYVVFWDNDSNPANGALGSAVVLRDDCGATGCTYAINNLNPSTTYNIYIQAQPSGFYSDFGACVGGQVTPCPAVETTPACGVTSVSADTSQCGQIELRWTPALGADGGYDIYRDLDPQLLPTASDGVISNPGGNTAINAGRTPGGAGTGLLIDGGTGEVYVNDTQIFARRRYYYKVFAFNSIDEASSGAEVNALNFCYEGVNFEEQ